MVEKKVYCNGGILDFIDSINAEQKKQGKSLVVGFECDKSHKEHIRFFDKDNKTIWFDDKFYREANKELIKMGALRRGRYQSQYWTQIATGHYTDFGLKVKMKMREFAKGAKKFLGMDNR